MSQTFRIGIVGVGAIAQMHARAIADLENAELVAACCRTEPKGRKFAEDFQCDWYPDFQTLYRQATPDVVTICTPSGAHLEPTLGAVQQGIHVLCEKPLEIDLKRAGQMVEAAKDAGVMLGGIFPQRFNPVVRTVYEAAQAGRFGSLAAAAAYVPWWREDSYYAADRWQGTLALDGGGALINQSIHAVDAMQWIAAAAGAGDVEQVFGFTAQRGHEPGAIEVEDTAVGVLRFSGGALGSILACTSMYPGTAMRTHFGGRDGTAEVHEQELVTWQFRHPRPEDDDVRQRFGGTTAAGGAADPMAIDYSNHTRNIADFLDAITGAQPLLIDAQEACKSLAIIRALYESAETGRPVAVDKVGA